MLWFFLFHKINTIREMQGFSMGSTTIFCFEKFQYCSGRDISLLEESTKGILELELLDYIYKRKDRINIKLRFDFQNQILRLTWEKIIRIFSKIKSVLEILILSFLFNKCSSNEVKVFPLYSLSAGKCTSPTNQNF